MFDNPQKELKQLENKLLASEQDGHWLDTQLEEAHRLLGDPLEKQDMDATQVFRPSEAPVRNYANGYGMAEESSVQNDYEDDLEDEQDNELSWKRGNRNLAILALAETAAIVGIVLYWVLKLL